MTGGAIASGKHELPLGRVAGSVERRFSVACKSRSGHGDEPGCDRAADKARGKDDRHEAGYAHGTPPREARRITKAMQWLMSGSTDACSSVRLWHQFAFQRSC